MGTVGKNPRDAANGDRRNGKPYDVHKPNRETWCGKCNRTGFLPVCFIKEEKIVETVAFCHCPFGYYKLKVEEHRGGPIKSYYELPDEMALKDKTATKQEILQFNRERYMLLRQSLGLDWYDFETGKWRGRNNEPASASAASAGLPTKAIMEKVKQEVTVEKKEGEKKTKRPRTKARTAAKPQTRAGQGEEDIPF